MNEKAVWKWIFAHMDANDLAYLAEDTNLQLKGFRKKTLQKNVVFMKPQIIKGFLESKGLQKVKKSIRDHVKECKECSAYLQMKEEELAKLMESEEKRIGLLKVLLASEDEKKQKAGKKLFYECIANEQEHGIKVDEPEEVADEEVHALKKTIKDQEVKLNKKEKKIAELQQQLSKKENEWKKEKAKWEKERKELQKMVQSKSEEFKKLGESYADKLAHLEKSYKEKLANAKNQIEGYKLEMDHIKEQYKALKMATEEAAAGTANGQVASKHIALIGNAKNWSMHPNHQLTLIGSEQLDEWLESEESWDEYDEVWLLKYDITPGRFRKLKNQIEKGHLKEFQTMNALAKYVDQLEASR
ncbi:hypothetical protein [Fictibacillus gelatini]|uniref:hypothetical protein n=1 Tax=Fictibacillus gelatini TaxID=225985 RepID=UPI0004213C00|nr:hypothetical protein [Fictibacillus gelatini]